MTRRITLAILVCVWAAMLAAGLTAYFATRAVLLRELDDRLIARASTLPEISAGSPVPPGEEDRYLIRGKTGQVIRRSQQEASSGGPQVLAAQFATLGDGRSYRSLTLKFPSVSNSEGTTIVYSGPADGFQAVMKRLAIWLGILGVAGSAFAVGAAAAATRVALKPLRGMAGVIGQIDERNLNRRIDVELLPDELTLVGQRLNDMLGRLEQHSDQRKQFLANASHELRTPVAALLTTLQVFLNRRETDVPTLRRALTQCLGDARLLRTLVDQLLSQVRSENAAAATIEEIDLSQLVRDCVNVAEGLALEKQVQISANLPGELFVRVDADRVRRVCLNLLSNAVAYNVEKGEISVGLSQIGKEAVLQVADTGIGIAAEDLPNVFSPFFRADKAHEANDHLGLGLFQVRTDVAALNGRYDIQSQLHRGTTITIRFPTGLGEASDRSTPPLEWPEPMISKN